MKRFWLTLIILIMAFSQSCATDKKSAVQKLVSANDPIDRMKLPEHYSPSAKTVEEPIIEIKVGGEIPQQRIIDPEILDTIPSKPFIKQVQIQIQILKKKLYPRNVEMLEIIDF